MKIVVNIQKKYIFSIISSILILTGAIVVYAALNPSIPNPGHGIAELQKCSEGETLKIVGGVWACVTSTGGVGSLSCTEHTVVTADLGKTSNQVCALSSSVCVSMFHAYGSLSTGEECSHTLVSFDVNNVGIINCCKVA